MKDHSLPAFPCEQSQNQDGTWNQTYETGMSLRDYFAGQAASNLPYLCYENSEHFVIKCYEVADAMLKEREK